MAATRSELVDDARHDLAAAWRVDGDQIRFARALAQLQTFTAAELLDYLEKPHKWAPEFVEWVIAGEPTDEAEDAWDVWNEACEALR